MIKLIEKSGHLYTPGNENTEGQDMMLLYVYPAGDCDVASWPMVTPWEGSTYTPERQRGILAGALYDAWEMGHVKERTVLLPDGTEFNIDDELSAWEAARPGVGAEGW